MTYDRETEGEWKQSTGKCIVGRYEGRTLDVRPATMIAASTFAAEYPDGRSLAPPDGKRRVVVPTERWDIDYDGDHFADYVDGIGWGAAAARLLGRGTARIWRQRGPTTSARPSPSRTPPSAPATPSRCRLAVVVPEADGALHAVEAPGFDLSATGGGEYAGDGATRTGATGRAADGRRQSRAPTRRLFAWQVDHGAEAFLLPE